MFLDFQTLRYHIKPFMPESWGKNTCHEGIKHKYSEVLDHVIICNVNQRTQKHIITLCLKEEIIGATCKRGCGFKKLYDPAKLR